MRINYKIKLKEKYIFIVKVKETNSMAREL